MWIPHWFLLFLLINPFTIVVIQIHIHNHLTSDMHKFMYILAIILLVTRYFMLYNQQRITQFVKLIKQSLHERLTKDASCYTWLLVTIKQILEYIAHIGRVGRGISVMPRSPPVSGTLFSCHDTCHIMLSAIFKHEGRNRTEF